MPSWLRLSGPLSLVLLHAEKATRAGAYAVVAVSGLAAILWTPQTITAVLGPTITTIWGFFLLVGGLLCLWAAIFERYLIEHPAILLIVAGMSLYLVALWAITAQGEVTRLTQTTIITGYALHLIARHIQLRRLAGVTQKAR